jgi:nucleotide-binding universal stress UspA family protein
MSNNGRVDTAAPAQSQGDEIVVGLDDGAASAAALRWAAKQSRVTGARLRVVHAWQLTPIEATQIGTRAAALVEASSADARARTTRRVIDTLGTDAAGLRWQLDIVEGGPGPALVRRSHGARLLVLGTREHTGLQRVVGGSVSHYCLSHADAPIVAVPASPDETPEVPAEGKTLATAGPLL